MGQWAFCIIGSLCGRNLQVLTASGLPDCTLTRLGIGSLNVSLAAFIGYRDYCQC